MNNNHQTSAPAHRAPDKPVDNSAYSFPTEPPRQGGDTIEDAIQIDGSGTYIGTTIGYTNNYEEGPWGFAAAWEWFRT
jgi:hypothetical protein